jgi:hypothetical protein
MFSDPLKLIPFVAYIGIFTCLAMKAITVNEAMLLLGATGAGHTLISSLSNVNPPKDESR